MGEAFKLLKRFFMFSKMNHLMLQKVPQTFSFYGVPIFPFCKVDGYADHPIWSFWDFSRKDGIVYAASQGRGGGLVGGSTATSVYNFIEGTIGLSQEELVKVSSTPYIYQHPSGPYGLQVFHARPEGDLTQISIPQTKWSRLRASSPFADTGYSLLTFDINQRGPYFMARPFISNIDIFHEMLYIISNGQIDFSPDMIFDAKDRGLDPWEDNIFMPFVINHAVDMYSGTTPVNITFGLIKGTVPQSMSTFISTCASVDICDNLWYGLAAYGQADRDGKDSPRYGVPEFDYRSKMKYMFPYYLVYVYNILVGLPSKWWCPQVIDCNPDSVMMKKLAKLCPTLTNDQGIGSFKFWVKNKSECFYTIKMNMKAKGRTLIEYMEELVNMTKTQITNMNEWVEMQDEADGLLVALDEAYNDFNVTLNRIRTNADKQKITMDISIIYMFLDTISESINYYVTTVNGLRSIVESLQQIMDFSGQSDPNYNPDDNPITKIENAKTSITNVVLKELYAVDLENPSIDNIMRELKQVAQTIKDEVITPLENLNIQGQDAINTIINEVITNLTDNVVSVLEGPLGTTDKDEIQAKIDELDTIMNEEVITKLDEIITELQALNFEPDDIILIKNLQNTVENYSSSIIDCTYCVNQIKYSAYSTFFLDLYDKIYYNNPDNKEKGPADFDIQKYKDSSDLKKWLTYSTRSDIKKDLYIKYMDKITNYYISYTKQQLLAYQQSNFSKMEYTPDVASLKMEMVASDWGGVDDTTTDPNNP